MKSEQNINDNNNVFLDENGNPVQTQYVDEFGNPIDPSLIDENGNYIGTNVTQYVDEFGNPIDPSLIDENGNYIGNQVQYVDELGNPVDTDSQSVQPQALDQNAIANALNAASSDEAELVTNVKANPISASERQMDDKELMQGMVTFDYNNVPITDIVNSIILDAINKGASDIHFDPFDEGIKIRIRIDGQLNDYSIVPLFVKKNMITRIKIISGMNITESRTPQDGAIRTELANKTIDLRVSCLPTNMGEKIVVRIMDYSMSAAGVEALDFSEKNLEKVNKMLALPNGIILVTGATGSGKSTTVYSMLQKLNIEGTNLITVEDPIEMNIAGINQVQAVSDIGLDFATVLRSILRQDPDVIMIGEIRDDETARIAVRASITGHLVLSTIHTNNSLNTIERLTDMSVERYLLGTALSGIVSQKLSRRLCEKCKTLRPTTDYEKEVFKKVLNKDIEEIYEPVGCPSCSRGYRGRIAIQEVLLLNQTIQDAITKGVSKATLRNLVYGENGTTTMLEDGLEKVLAGKTSFDEILKLIDLEDDLGSGTQLGLDDQIEASSMNNNATFVPTGNQPININISPDLLAGLNLANLAQTDEDDEEEVIIKPVTKKKKKKKKKIVEIDPEELKEMMNDESEESIEEETDIETLEEITENNEEIQDFEVLDETSEIDPQELIPETIDNFKIDSLVEETPQEDELTTLFNKLLDTKKIIGKKKYNLKVKSILEDIKPLINENTEIPEDVTNYINEIEKNDNITSKVRKEIIEAINTTFNINEEIEEDLFELIEDDNELDTESFDDLIKDIEEIKDEEIDEEDLEKIDLNDIDNDIEINLIEANDEEVDFDTLDEDLDVVEEKILLTDEDFNNDFEMDLVDANEQDSEEETTELDLDLEDDNFNAIDDSIINSLLDTLGDIDEEEV